MREISLKIFNKELVSEADSTFNISFEDIEKAYEKVLSEYPLEEVNIVFVEPEYIQDLNKRYRKIDAPTDVLSFNIEEGRKGEIYISPEYVYRSFKGDSFEEEILRLIIHGTLHILGHDHKESMNDSPKEKMFLLQEELLVKFKKICC